MPDKNQADSGSLNDISDLMKVALGEMQADLAVVNAEIVNVYTGEILGGNTILVKGTKIAYVGKNGSGSVGSSTLVIDAAGKTVIPGLIDGHTHVDHPYTPYELIKWAMKGGVTTIITEIDGLAVTLGYRGIIHFLKAVENQPINIFTVIPPTVTISPSSEEHAITPEELRKLLKMDNVLGLGEPYWAPVIKGSKRITGLICETLKAGKSIDGHSTGAKDNKMQAYFSTGISSCHEPITANEARERLRLGLYIPIREGEVRRDLEAVSELKDEGIDLSRLILSTDGIGPVQLMEDGYMEFVVQKAINLGFNPVTAIKMATLNPAQRFGLDKTIGGIAPGKQADMVVIPDIRTIKAESVISKGKLVSRYGRLLTEPERQSYPGWTKRSIRTAGTIRVSDFDIRTPTTRKSVKIRVINQTTSLVTREIKVDFPVSDGRIHIDVTRDLLKIAEIENSDNSGKIFTGFITGFNMKRGAVATSYLWDINGIVVIGADETDMAAAVNRLKEINGGTVICADSRILAEMALPIGGIVSEDSMETLASKSKDIQRTAEELGFPYPDLRTTLSVTTTPAIPFLRICEDGLFRVDLDSFVPLIVD